MKHAFRLRYLLTAGLFLLMMQHVEAQFTWPYSIRDGRIVTEVPQRKAGQRHALSLTTAKLPVVRVGFVGLGMRGPGAVERFTHIPGTQIVALCDYERERAEACQQLLEKASMPPAAIYSGEKGYEALCRRDDIDLVYIATDWLHHFPVAQAAMQNGKHVAIEVPSAMNLHDIWALIDMAEEKRLHCVMLENCCYDFFELNSLNMAQQGVFGEIIYVQGAYRHELSPYWDEYWKKDADDKLGWRLDYNAKYRGDIYPTHGLGPVAQALDIHRGDRMTTLIAMDTHSFNGRKFVEKATGQPCDSFANGDHTTTLIRTAKGKIIEIHHNVMTPQPYNRMYQLTGTKGFANKYPVEGYAVEAEMMASTGNVRPDHENLTAHRYLSKEDKEALVSAYRSPLVERYEKKAREVGGHGGMDFIMDSRLIYCLQHGLPMDIDVYDLAEWCCLAELGAISMNNGNMPVEVPDFTRGHWNDKQGYRHAFASPEEEAKAEAAANEFTRQLKEKGAGMWAKQKAKVKK